MTKEDLCCLRARPEKVLFPPTRRDSRSTSHSSSPSPSPLSFPSSTPLRSDIRQPTHDSFTL